MAFKLSLALYRLRFKRPFGTAHGLRDGTDSLFLRLDHEGVSGFGEVTLPPYLTETVVDSRQYITELWRARESWSESEILAILTERRTWAGHPALRAGFSTAWMDWLNKHNNGPVIQPIERIVPQRIATVMTIGFCTVAEALEQLDELPRTGALKLKVGDESSQQRVNALLKASDAMILLDGNQGLKTVAEAVNLAQAIGKERLLGFEQPFQAQERAMNKQLHESTGAVVYGDESIQGLDDLEAARTWFGGVNIKLMKCGGLDRARTIAKRARELGLKVMLGSMSESSLGCTVMAHLQSLADIVDLDGPWLLANDPFEGVTLQAGRLVIPDGPGLGYRPVAELDYIGV